MELLICTKLVLKTTVKWRQKKDEGREWKSFLKIAFISQIVCKFSTMWDESFCVKKCFKVITENLKNFYAVEMCL